MNNTNYMFGQWKKLWVNYTYNSGIISITNDAYLNEVYSDLCMHYTELQRDYHNLKHIQHGLEIIEREFPLSTPLTIAWWFHDVIYNITSGDNEEKSAEYMRTKLKFLPTDVLDYIEKLILATKHNGIFDKECFQSLVIMDIDLSTFAGNDFPMHSANVKKEYLKAYTEEQYNAGRLKFFESMLERKFIYHTKLFRDLYENNARLNIERELITLKENIK